MPDKKKQRLKESEQRERCINESEKKLFRKIKSLQVDLSDVILSFFLNEITFKNGKLVSNPSNFEKVARVESVYLGWIRSNIKEVLAIVVKGIRQLHKDNEAYFTKVLGKEIVKESARIFKILSSRLGLDKDGETVRGGYMETVLTHHGSSIIELKDEALRSIVTGQTVAKFQEDIVSRVKGKDNAPGLLEQHFQRHMTDVWQQYDREAGRQFAQELGLKYAIYQGGIIKTTRPFCEVRNNRVFTIEEIALFGTPKDKYGGYSNKSEGDFNGKNDNYNPFLDCGGWGCRHNFDYVSDELGELLKKQQDGK